MNVAYREESKKENQHASQPVSRIFLVLLKKIFISAEFVLFFYTQKSFKKEKNS